MTDPAATHFIGSLVLAPSPANGPIGVQEFLVIDGQQRLTTMSILLCAVRDHRKEHESPEHFERINEQYLINKWKKGAQRLKLLPTRTAMGDLLGEAARAQLPVIGALISSIVLYVNANDAGSGFYRLATSLKLLAPKPTADQKLAFWTNQLNATYDHYA